MKKILTIVALFVLGSLPVSAAEFYGLVEGGKAHITTQSDFTWNPELKNSSPLVWSAGLGLKLTPKFAVEAKYTDFGNVSASGSGTVDEFPKAFSQTGNASSHIAGPSVSVVLSPLGRNDIDPHVKLGAFYNNTSSVHFTRSDGFQYSAESGNKVSPMIGLGITVNNKFSIDYTLVKQTNAWAQHDLTVQALTVGFQFH